MFLNSKRVTEMFGLMTIGDSVATIINPRRHARLWEDGPELWQDMMNKAEDNPTATRLLGLASLAFGIWLVSQQQPES